MRMLVEQPALDANQGPLSLLAGLYQFELTPPHADLLGRMAQVAGAAGAPFVAGDRAGRAARRRSMSGIR